MSQNAKYLVVLGAAESGIGAALLALKQGWKIWVSDGGTIKEQYKSILEANGIAYEEGGHTEAQILSATLVVKSPGIPDKAPIVKQIIAAGIPIESEVEFAYRYAAESKIIAITGSNGKSTTTKLTYHLLKEAGYDVAMVGNIGISFARQVAKAPKPWYVLEISSFQLDDIRTFRPRIAVLLNITPDHLDRYNYQMEHYVRAKFRITMNQTEDDLLVLNSDDEETKQYLLQEQHNIHAKTIFITMNGQQEPQEGAFRDADFLHFDFAGDRFDASIHDLTIKGRHNQYNSMAAGISAMAAGVRSEKIRESLSTFKGLEHRLEHVASIKGVEFINDSKATNVNSVWYALESMSKPTILILGGQDKGNDYTEIAELVQEKVKAIICLGVDNTPILNFFSDKVDTIIETRSAQDAVLAAYSVAEKGDVVLLSPACASFDLFNNYEERGRRYKEAVKNL